MEFLLSFILFAILLTTLASAWFFAPWVPSHKADIARALRLAGLREGERFVDLGSGDGKVVFMAAAMGADAEGVELGLPLFLWTAILAPFKKGRKRFVLGNLFRHPLVHADVVFIFGMPHAHLWNRLRPKLEKELRPGSRVVSSVFPILGWEPDEIDKPEGSTSLYLYRR